MENIHKYTSFISHNEAILDTGGF